MQSQAESKFKPRERGYITLSIHLFLVPVFQPRRPTDRLARSDLANAFLFCSSLNLPRPEWENPLGRLREADDPESLSKHSSLSMIREYKGLRLPRPGRLPYRSPREPGLAVAE